MCVCGGGDVVERQHKTNQEEGEEAGAGHEQQQPHRDTSQPYKERHAEPSRVGVVVVMDAAAASAAAAYAAAAYAAAAYAAAAARVRVPTSWPHTTRSIQSGIMDSCTQFLDPRP